MKTILLPVAVVILATFAISVITAPKAAAKTSMQAPIKVYRECPFCQRPYPGKMNADGKFEFDDHGFVRLVVTEHVSFETCTYIYYKVILEAAHLMQQRGAGRFIEDGVAEPTPTPTAR